MRARSTRPFSLVGAANAGQSGRHRPCRQAGRETGWPAGRWQACLEVRQAVGGTLDRKHLPCRQGSTGTVLPDPARRHERHRRDRAEED